MSRLDDLLGAGSSGSDSTNGWLLGSFTCSALDIGRLNEGAILTLINANHSFVMQFVIMIRQRQCHWPTIRSAQRYCSSFDICNPIFGLDFPCDDNPLETARESRLLDGARTNKTTLCPTQTHEIPTPTHIHRHTQNHTQMKC